MRTHKGLGGENEPTDPPTSVGGPLLSLTNDQYAIFAPDVEAVTAEVLAVPLCVRSCARARARVCVWCVCVCVYSSCTCVCVNCGHGNKFMLRLFRE